MDLEDSEKENVFAECHAHWLVRPFGLMKMDDCADPSAARRCHCCSVTLGDAAP